MARGLCNVATVKRRKFAPVGLAPAIEVHGTAISAKLPWLIPAAANCEGQVVKLQPFDVWVPPLFDQILVEPVTNLTPLAPALNLVSTTYSQAASPGTLV